MGVNLGRAAIRMRSRNACHTVLDSYMISVENPYTPGAATQPPELTGRDDLIEHFRFTITRLVHGIPGQSLMPVGLRRVGKTVLLNVFEQQAASAGAVVEHLEADQDTLTPHVLARRMRSALYKLAPRIRVRRWWIIHRQPTLCRVKVLG